MTSGGVGVTNGTERRSRLLAWLIFAGVGLAFAVVNAVSVADERGRIGRPVESWQPWSWELTSLASFLIIAPAIIWLSQRLRPPRLAWPAAVGIHLLLTIPASLLHVAVMTAFRHAIYAALGDTYSGGGSMFDVLLYEYRKDLITYAALALLPHLTARLLIDPQRRPLGTTEHRLVVRDGTRRLRLMPREIDWAQAAGNYVELHGRFGTVLHRETLVAMEKELGPHGFARIHRRRIVRGAAVTAVDTNPSGDFEITLASGVKVSGSRRYRANLELKPASAVSST